MKKLNTTACQSVDGGQVIQAINPHVIFVCNLPVDFPATPFWNPRNI